MCNSNHICDEIVETLQARFPTVNFCATTMQNTVLVGHQYGSNDAALLRLRTASLDSDLLGHLSHRFGAVRVVLQSCVDGKALETEIRNGHWSVADDDDRGPPPNCSGQRVTVFGASEDMQRAA